jgi:hypothetical protein
VFVFKFVKVVEGSWIYTLVDNSLGLPEKPNQETSTSPAPKTVVAKKSESTKNKGGNTPIKNMASKVVWPQQPDATSTSPSESPRNPNNIVPPPVIMTPQPRNVIHKPMVDLKNNAFSLYSDLSMNFMSGAEDFYEPQVTADLWPPYVLGNPSENLSRLSDMAEEEIWDKKGKPLAVLFEYVALIFRGAVRSNNNLNGRSIVVNTDGRKCAINTGLMTRRSSSEYILALCQRLPDNRYAVRSFVTWWDAVQSHGFEHCDMPMPVNFYPRNEIAFDNKLRLQFNVDQLIDKCESQFPQRWRNLKREELSLFLNGLTESLRRQVEQDSGSVVPAVYTSGSELTLQYLLPLRVERDLVISMEKKGQYYLGHTVLRAESEYAKARVLGKQKGYMKEILLE